MPKYRLCFSVLSDKYHIVSHKCPVFHFCYSSALCCLSLVMSAYSVPQNLDVGMEQNNCERNPDSLLKEAIMKWVLSCYLQEEMEECAELPPVLCR